MTFGIRSTLIGSFVILVVLACTLTLSVLFLVDETEKRFQFLGSVKYPTGNQSAVFSELTLGQAIVILMSDSSQSELRELLLDAATDTLGDVPAVGPAAVGLAASISGIVAVVVLLLRNVSSPFQKLLLAARAVSRGNYYINFSQSDAAESQNMSKHSPENKGGANLKDSSNDELSQLYGILKEINTTLLQQKKELEETNEELATKNRELAESNQKLKVLDKMKSDFISIASHELRNPVQPILGCVQLLRKGLLSSDEAIDVVENEAIRLKDLAQSILDVSRIESGQFKYEMKLMNVSKVIENVAATSRSLLSESVSLSLDLDDTENSIIRGDETRIAQVLSNVMGNAIKFTNQGVITISSRIARSDGMIEIKVKDTGSVIPNEMLPILFEKFAMSQHGNTHGSGLGLFIAKSIIEAHKGRIMGQNNPDGVGTTFTIVLPLAPPHAADHSIPCKTAET